MADRKRGRRGLAVDAAVMLAYLRAARHSGIAREHVAAEVGRWCGREPTELHSEAQERRRKLVETLRGQWRLVFIVGTIAGFAGAGPWER